MKDTAIKLLKMIEQHGFVAYIVGGYPRDMYLNRVSVDIDICTNATPKDLKNIFGDVMLPSVNYGSVIVVMNKIRFDITTFRKDIKYDDNRFPIKIKYIDSLSDDLKRRDFTINTLCIDSNGDLIDLLNSKNDLDNNLIRMVGNPKIRLKEDALRILRVIRFATVLNFKIDPELKKYIKKYSYLLSKLSYYRKKEELDKIFSSSNANYGIDLIKELGLDKALELSNINSVVVTSSSIGIWSQLDVLSIYNFTNNEKEMISKINELNKLDILDKNILYKYDLYAISVVGEIKNIDKKLILTKYNELPIKSRQDIVISSSNICELLNRKPGSFLKEIYESLESEIINNNLVNDYEHLKKYIIDNYDKNPIK